MEIRLRLYNLKYIISVNEKCLNVPVPPNVLIMRKDISVLFPHMFEQIVAFRSLEAFRWRRADLDELSKSIFGPGPTYSK